MNIKTDEQKIENMLSLLYEWYPKAARDLPWRMDIDPYHVWISEIMLQQTRVEAVKEYYKRFLECLPTIGDLASVDEELLLKLWQGLGYYNRARNLKKAAGQIVERYGGVFPDSYEEIRALPGIGNYTAGAIGSTCFELSTPAVDGNVLRVYARVMAYKENIDRQAVKNDVTKRLAGAYKKGYCRLATQSLMELGATVCVPNGAPHCEICPLASICESRSNMEWKNLPVRSPKKKRKIVDMTVFVLRCGGELAIRKRPKQGLLSGLWEFPHVEGVFEKQQAADIATKWSVSPDRIWMESHYTHIFSHVEWRMTAYYFDCFTRNEDFVWVTRAKLQETYALPSAFMPFFDKLTTD
ncbi:MAG: A/G-specific adenine glycosylase [Lachnospiraceae bacterium]|nr:A/G-specific adenine glycosylase [Lachnospiraceae bacterium]